MSRWLWFSITLTVIALGATLFLYTFGRDYLPSEAPVHWNIHGKPDQFVPRDDVLPYLLISPISMGVMVGLTLLLPWLSPKSFGVERFRGTYEYVMTLVVALFGYIQLTILLATLGMETIRLMLCGLFLFFTLLGNVLGKVRRNFWMGVRTPWTLASELVWNQTHRVAAWLFVAIGLIGFVAALCNVDLIVVLVVFMAGALFPVPYSLYLYKRLQRTGKLDAPSESTT
jgi:uncharacterized membrane protein